MDEQTFRDLEIFKERGQKSLFHLIDFTVTGEGSSMLKQRMLHPFSGINEIQQTQGDISLLLLHVIKKLLLWEKTIFILSTHYTGITDEYD